MVWTGLWAPAPTLTAHCLPAARKQCFLNLHLSIAIHPLLSPLHVQVSSPAMLVWLLLYNGLSLLRLSHYYPFSPVLGTLPDGLGSHFLTVINKVLDSTSIMI